MTSKKVTLIILIAILLLAGFFRLYRISDYLNFLGDEGRDVMVVRNILHGDLTFLGPRSSAGDFYLGPIYYYFMAPFLFLSNYHPVGPAIMVALFSIATVYLIYRIGREFFSKNAGLIAAILYSISPLVIIHSRSSWNPNVMPFFSIAALYSAYKGIERKNFYLLGLSGVLLGIAMQLHYLTIFLGGILFLYILLVEILSKGVTNKIVELFKKYIIVFAGFILGFSPFLLFEIKHGFPNTKTISNFILASGDVSAGGKFGEIIKDVFFRSFGRLVTAYPQPETVSIIEQLPIAIWYYLTLILAFASIALTFYQLTQRLREKGEFRGHLLILLWFSLGVLFFGLYKKPIYDYLFTFMFPAPFLLTGNLLGNLIERKKVFAAVSIISIISLVAINLIYSPLRKIPNYQYEQVKMISEFILDKAQGKPFNFALITGGNSDHAYRYIFEIEGKKPVTIQIPEVDPERKTITDQLFIVCEEIPCNPVGHPLWEVAGFGRGEIAGEWQVSVLKVYKLVHYKGE
ncbi:MAG: glycosyltransferase family 39 protein [Candidatus Levybacteria bacterium]|nr:glycosyltransferase family 39 protein [Candidatus Levybacteria bacterium]